ncbi:MAG: sulfite exporter TauE/SafE family protein [Clostridia bacterium]|nr:sulfite exporter TauE/SafE family protein [Clostridia bacterium]MBQ8334246.1 sulfite exporter TauE/SafE family protein [Clostridia bacterium]MBQ8370499.1 sulfite exporter TauE/SafE family protein [Clostridia bacterium]MBQ8513467.1 sulfite exporter TauE/SafE family protein [Clostridia bacterium]
MMKTFLICVLCGFLAQLIDGTLGMAYGVSSSTLLRAMGQSSAMASFCTHTAEIFTTLASGVSHFTMKNIDRSLLIRLIVPGVIGGVTGAYLLTGLDDSVISPVVSVYLIIMGAVIFAKAFKKPKKQPRKIGKAVYPLALIGGFSDSIGGGGWGPVVTSTLVAADCDVRTTIGSVNTAEFFVTLAESAAFFLTIGSLGDALPATVGLILGGVAASPIAAWLCRKIPVKPLIAIVGAVIVVLNAWKLVHA